MLQYILDSLNFFALLLTRYKIQLSCLKSFTTSAHDNFHLTKFEFRVVEKEYIICGGIYFQLRWKFSQTHTHTCIFVAFLGTGNSNSHLIALNNLWKRKMSTNVMIHWQGGWVSQTHEVENNDNTILDI